MLFGNHGQALLVMQERHSRLLATARLPGKAAEPVAQAMTRILSPFPPHWRRSVAFDNGTEFAQHYQLHQLGVETFFCDVRSPGRRGQSRTASAACDATCRAEQTSPVQTKNSSSSPRQTITPLAGHWAISPPPKSIQTKCCT